MAATAAEDEEKHEQAVEEYRRDFPGDPAVDLMCHDSHMIAERYDEALAGCDRIAKAVGGDPYLDVVRGNILVAANKPDEAAKRAEQALAAEPELKELVQLLQADIALAKEDYPALAKPLRTLETEHGRDMSGVTTDEAYADFRESSQYQQWAKERKK